MNTARIGRIIFGIVSNLHLLTSQRWGRKLLRLEIILNLSVETPGATTTLTQMILIRMMSRLCLRRPPCLYLVENRLSQLPTLKSLKSTGQDNQPEYCQSGHSSSQYKPKSARPDNDLNRSSESQASD